MLKVNSLITILVLLTTIGAADATTTTTTSSVTTTVAVTTTITSYSTSTQTVPTTVTTDYYSYSTVTNTIPTTITMNYYSYSTVTNTIPTTVTTDYSSYTTITNTIPTTIIMDYYSYSTVTNTIPTTITMDYYSYSTVTNTIPTTVTTDITSYATVTSTIPTTVTTSVTYYTTATTITTHTVCPVPTYFEPDYTVGTQPCPKSPIGFVSQHGQLKASGNKIVDIHGQPVILRGMSLFWSQWMGQYYNSGVVSTLVNDWKVTVVRAAMGVESGGYLTQPATERQKVINVIEAALDQGIYVIVDWNDHNANQHQADAIAFFQDIASIYGNCPHVIFEPFHEPELQDWKTVIKPYHEALVSAIRTKSQNLVLLGSRQWNQRLDEVADNPLDSKVYTNIAYTVHFWAATHKEKDRDIVQVAIDKDLPVFASECGFTEATGDGTIDMNEFYKWYNFMESNYISWVISAISDNGQTSAVLKSGASISGNWNIAVDLTTSGATARNVIRKSNS